MARRRPNYGFERKQRADKKAAKKQAKLEKKQGKKDETAETAETDAPVDSASTVE